MDKKLPPFQEPDWTKLNSAVVAWAVDADGKAWTYDTIPYRDDREWICAGAVLDKVDTFDTSTFDWRKSLRIKDEASEQREAARGLQALADRTELERLAEVAWKGMMNHSGGHEALALAAFKRAEGFIAVRNKRREA